MPAHADERLAIRCQLGEPGALEDLVRRWHPSLHRYVRAWLTDSSAVDDVLQTTWLGILRGLPGLRTPAAIAPWIFRIARATVMSHLRRRYAEPVVLEDWDAEDSSIEEPLRWADLERAVDRLAEPEREAIVLFYLDELSLADVAAVLDVPVGTVKSRLHRARRQLRMLLEADTR